MEQQDKENKRHTVQVRVPESVWLRFKEYAAGQYPLTTNASDLIRMFIESILLSGKKAKDYFIEKERNNHELNKNTTGSAK